MAEKAGVVSLGCDKNLVDTEVMLGVLTEAGYEITNRPEEADVLIVNTCGFIGPAKEESIKAIVEMAGHKKGRCRALVVAGCLAQKYRRELLTEIPEIDAVIGTGEVPAIAGIVQRALDGERVEQVGAPSFLYDHGMPRVMATPGYTAYLKIAEGCSNRCSYCVIPDLRGSYRSRPIDSIVAEARALISRGVKELNLLAQDTTGYGHDLYGEYRLAGLVEEPARLDGLAWLRLLYCYPTRITDELIEVVASEKRVCKYLDVPLQHVDGQILRRMNRRGDRVDIAALVSAIRANIPDVTLRTTFIVGFPGEGEEQFRGLYDFIAEVEFDRVGVFTYSREEGTPAARMKKQVPEEVKQERYHRLMARQQQISAYRNQAWVGRTVTALVEKTAFGRRCSGRTERDAPGIDGQIYFAGRGQREGDMVPVVVTAANAYDLEGRLADESRQ